MVASAMLEKFQVAISPQPVVRSTSCFVLGWGFRGRWIHGAIFDSNKFKMAAANILDNFEWPYLRNGSRSTYIARIARSSLRAFLFTFINSSSCIFTHGIRWSLWSLMAGISRTVEIIFQTTLKVIADRVVS